MNKLSNIQISNNGLSCSLSGMINKNFSPKVVNDKLMFQGKIFLNNIIDKEKIIDYIKETSDISLDDVKLSNLIVTNIWNSYEYECCKDAFSRGAVIEADGILKYKVYDRFLAGPKIQLFFNVNHVYKIKEALQKYDSNLYIQRKIPQIVSSQF